MAQLTRRNFVQVAGMTAATTALAACDNTAAPADDAEPEAEAEPEAAPAADGDIYAAPDASAYPIEPDGEGVEALYETKESRGGQIIYTKVIPGEWSKE